MKKIIVSGMTGMVGSYLAPFLRDKGYEVLKFSGSIDGADVVINLSGENIGKGRWTKKKKEKIYKSRIETTSQLVNLMEKTKNPPAIFISASAVGYYGANAKVVASEEVVSGTDFLAQVCRDWEKEANQYTKGRVVIMRFGVVLTKTSGFLQKLSKIAKFGLLGIFGSGEQKTSWIAIEDLAEVIFHCINHKEIIGAVNVTTAYPFSNRECVEIVTKSVLRWRFLPIPAFFITLIFGEKGRELLLVDQSVYPKKLLDTGFRFKFLQLKEVVLASTNRMI